MNRNPLSVLVALILILALAVPVAAHSSDPSRPETLQLGLPILDDLVGARGGSFAYFQVLYEPGDWLTIHTLFVPSDRATLSGVGVNVYGPSGQRLDAASYGGQSGEVDWLGRFSAPTRLLVQVYNYIPGFRVSFGIVAEYSNTLGQARGNLRPIVRPLNDPASPEPLPLDTLIHSRAFSESATSFNYYAVEHPGGNQTLTIMASFTPNDSLTMRYVGMHIHDIGAVAADPVQVARPGASPGMVVFTSRLAEPHTYLVEIFNELANYRVDYHVFATTDAVPSGIDPASLVVETGTGVTGSVTGQVPGDIGAEPPLPTPVPQHADVPVTVSQSGNYLQPVPVQLNGPRLGGRLVGDRAGTFAYYVLDYAGGSAPVTFHLLTNPANATDGEGVGINLYGPDGSIEGEGIVDEPGHVHLSGQGPTAGPWLVQVYNYLHGVGVDFQIFVTND